MDARRDAAAPYAATRSLSDPNLRREVTEAGVTRPELLLQSIRLVQVFLSQSPANPIADEASLALLHAFLDLEKRFIKKGKAK